MLTPTAYWVAMSIYVSAALIAVGLAHRWWFTVLSTPVARVISALLLAWLVTPAQPSAGADTLAPALVIAVFNTLFGDGWASARQAVVLLGLSSGVAVLLAIASSWLPLKSRRIRVAANDPVDKS